jgi:hypothetical protein
MGFSSSLRAECPRLLLLEKQEDMIISIGKSDG